jgi:hypothetical protein
VQKVTNPAGSEAGWTFTLTGPGTPPGGEQVTTTGTDPVVFQTVLQEGPYTITETPQPGWGQTSAVGCSFNPDYPADSDRTFACTVVNAPSKAPHNISFFKANSCRARGRRPDLITPLLPIQLGNANITTCKQAVAILLKPSTKYAEHFLAAQLLVAKLNIKSGAVTCPALTQAVQTADSLLIQIGYTGNTRSRIVGSSHPLRQQFLDTAAILQRYNNGQLC